ncbi:hypothetical protein [Neobacillus rhizophilus]|uniref:Uncharacterized protein n=1 Tax=Neobacillus rhizophilus TaxID=2833579 RepID=A0A942YW40_9BACI|nr:hypothetical protein [Neobacillus rhizophilus]MBS4214709.1 hypothetical protein [Neobacillus rhizophilus]
MEITGDEMFIDVPDDPYAFFEYVYEKKLTDGLPIIPPTEELVETFISYIGMPRDQVIAEVEPRKGVATVEKIAVNAIMAGCRREYSPVLIAMIQAITKPEFNLGGIQATTNPVAPLTIVNGKIRNKIGMNAGMGALGPGNRANATMGRALRMILLNIGGAFPGKIDKATLGMPGKYTFCIPENEEESQWEPLSVELGYAKGENVVTIFGGQGTNNVLTGGIDSNSQLSLLADCMSNIGNNNFLTGHGNPCILLSPGHVRVMVKDGWTKTAVKECLFEKSKRKLADFPKELFQPDMPKNLKGDTAYVCDKPDDIKIVVVGGNDPYHIQYVPNFGATNCVSQSF